MLDFLEDHKDKMMWYAIIFGSTAGLIFSIYLIVWQSTISYAFLQGMTWGVVSTVLSFITILGWKHLK